MSGKLTTHILDTVRGRPAPSIVIELWSIDPVSGLGSTVKFETTNSDGRAILLADGDLKSGVYELVFVIGTYFSEFYPPNSLPFFERIPIRFGVDNPDQHYHVPLLVSPWSYSTYRGS
ncbi:hydroxyisourate hydrolase [Synechococcus sp. PCC 7502]|uniref:hydroxyisourate hydrolase n=1 Tax=Synechococcus sp. PCC 7502 TaxID=1173263 RepID=UPI00029FFC5A|nr:hydroxyisourate hydrolase [Synechococcus sp. PCC 7502]AFY74566.1 hydroxyisourate hydrolase [Synechococcus sp. PCC 7502]